MRTSFDERDDLLRDKVIPRKAVLDIVSYRC